MNPFLLIKKYYLAVILLVLFASTGTALGTTLQITGFETGDSLDANSSSGTFSVQTTTVRSGAYSLEINPVGAATGYFQLNGYNANSGQQNSTLSTGTTYNRFYFRYATKPSSNNEMFAQYTSKIQLRINSSGNVEVYDTGLNLVATGSTVLSANTWYRIEFVCQNSASGDYEVRINGSTELSGSGFNFAATNCTALQIGKRTNYNSNTVDFFFDDLVINNTGYPGDGAVKMILPNATGTYDDFTIGAGSGSNYEQVDDVPYDSDTTYVVSTLNNTHAQVMNLQNMSTVGITGTINTIKVVHISKKDAAGGASDIGIRIRSGATDSDPSSNPGDFIGTSYALYARIIDTDPNTSSAWTISGVDALQAGVFERDTVDPTRTSLVAVMVGYIPGAPAATRAGGTIVRGIARLRGLIRFR